MVAAAKVRKKQVKKAVNVIKGSDGTNWEKQVTFLKGKGITESELREAFLQVHGRVPWDYTATGEEETAPADFATSCEIEEIVPEVAESMR
jgi:hypothetical protein